MSWRRSPSTRLLAFVDNSLVLVSTTMASVVSFNLSDWIDTPDSVFIGWLVSSSVHCGVLELEKQNRLRMFLS